MKQIVPAILTSSREEFHLMLDTTASFCAHVQVDIMDGNFVASTSIRSNDLSSLSAKVYTEVHLMVCDPLEWIEPCRKFGAQHIIFHVEISQNISDVIRAVRDQGLKVGLAINPGTPLETLTPYADAVDSVLFMSVIPGFYGAPFVPEVLEKIKLFQRKHKLSLGIDGGVKLSNVKEVSASGVDYICVGSAILKDKHPAKAYSSFTALLSA